MKLIGFAGCFLFLLVGASLAEAADLQIAKSPPFLPPPPFSWTGFYLGGNVGAGFGSDQTSVNVGPAPYGRHREPGDRNGSACVGNV